MAVATAALLLSPWLKGAEAAAPPAVAEVQGLEFSGSLHDSVLPEGGQGRPTENLGFLDRQGSLGGVMEGPSALPSPSQSRATGVRADPWLGQLDMEKLWSDAPGSSGPGSSAFEQAAGVRGGLTWDQSPGAPAGGEAPLNSSRSRSRSGMGSNLSPAGGRGQSLDPVVDFSSSMTPMSAVLDVEVITTGWSVAPAGVPSVGGGVVQARDPRWWGSAGDPGPRTMRELITGGPEQPTSRDAALLEMDGTRRALNPYLPEQREDYQSSASLMRGAGFVQLPGSSGIGERSEPSLMRELTTKVQGPSSLTPAMAMPATDRTATEWLRDPNLIKLNPRRF